MQEQDVDKWERSGISDKGETKDGYAGSGLRKTLRVQGKGPDSRGH